MSGPNTWEYLECMVDRDGKFYLEGDITDLNYLGTNRWELCSVIQIDSFNDRSLYFAARDPRGKYRAIFKRPAWMEL